MEQELNQIENIINSGNTDRALMKIKELMAYPEYKENAKFWFLLGKALWREGKRSEATNAFRTAIHIDPDGPGKIALEMADEISSFFNPDILNP